MQETNKPLLNGAASASLFPQQWLRAARPGGQVSTRGAKQTAATGMLVLSAACGLSAQLHFHSVKYST